MAGPDDTSPKAVAWGRYQQSCVCCHIKIADQAKRKREHNLTQKEQSDSGSKVKIKVLVEGHDIL